MGSKYALASLLAALSAATPLLGAAAPVASGIDISGLDPAIRPQDDFYRYADGKWIAASQPPAYMGNWNRTIELQLNIYRQLSQQLEILVADPNLRDPEMRKLADVYDSYVSEDAVNKAGLEPLHAELRRIATLRTASDVAAELAHFIRLGVGAPLDIEIHPDAKDSTRYVPDLEQSGLSLPDRDYYLSDQPRLAEVRGKFRDHVDRILTLAKDNVADTDATAIVAFETKLASAQWTGVANRDPRATYNLVSADSLAKLAPGFDWKRFLTEAGLAGKIPALNVSQPTYLSQLAVLVQQTPVSVWRAYFQFRLIDQESALLSAPFADERALFYGATLSGTTIARPRWLRALTLIEDGMGDALGRLYAEKYFSPQAKARAEELVKNLVAAFRSGIDSLEWMSPATRREAQAKLSALSIKVGVPDKWKSYAALRTDRHDLVGNALRMHAFAYDDSLAKLGKPVTHGEWRMTPQQVNGYYEASQNEVVISAALLQPPYFQADADSAVNYGGVGWWIAHEISHAFDDHGSQYDGHGNLRDWWSKEDHEQFAQRTRKLAEQYSRYEIAPGYPINGELTVGENIADNSGLAVAYRAYHLSLGSQVAPVLDGLTGDQRFYLSFATIWAGKRRESDAVRSKTDSHAPAQFRVQGSVVNQSPFYSAFDIRSGDGMYVPPEQRVSIW